MKKLFIIVGLCSILTIVLVACSNSSNGGSGGSTASGTTQNAVHMNDSNFLQSSITIKKGESVTLIDDDPVTPHIISNGTWENEAPKAAIEPGAPKVQNVQINGGSSGPIGPFTTAGTFKLYCTIHTDMNLTVIVK